MSALHPLTMTELTASATARIARIRLYRRLFVGFIVAGVLTGLVLRFLDYPLVGEVVYWAGIGLALAVWVGTSVPLFDERDAALERRASNAVVYLFAVVLVVGASAARILPRVTDVVVPPEIWGALYGYVALFAAWAVSYIWLRYRP